MEKTSWYIESSGEANYTRSFISRTITRFKKHGTVNDAPRSERKRSSSNLRKVKQMLARRPTLSYRKIDSRAAISNTSAQRIISKDLGIRSFKRTKTEALTPQTVQKRVQRINVAKCCSGVSKMSILKTFFFRMRKSGLSKFSCICYKREHDLQSHIIYNL